tara:strand:+ start:790 stop:2034 length:1245 start_codon:yes stop_codon:yes gene_type:complete
MASGVEDPLKGTNIPTDFEIPACGIEDLDRALFNLFDKRLSFSVEVNSTPKKVPVVFSTGERFALTRRAPPVRDKDNALILPIIAIKRNSINFSPGQEGLGSPIANRDQDGYVIKRRLDKSDRDYQNIVNKLKLKSQQNVASRNNFADQTVFPGNDTKLGPDYSGEYFASRRNGSNLSLRENSSGHLLENNLGNNIFEIITVPYPKFIVASYEITFWTQYTVHMNQLIESLVAQFDGQEKGFKIETDKGYEFSALFQGEFSPADNFTDFTSDERIIRYTFQVKVPGFLLATRIDGVKSPFRRYLTAPQIEFGIDQISAQAIKTSKSTVTGEEIGKDGSKKFILSDVELLDKTGNLPLERGQTGAELKQLIENPFTGEKNVVYSRVKTRNQRRGETVASSLIVVNLETLNDQSQD